MALVFVVEHKQGNVVVQMSSVNILKSSKRSNGLEKGQKLLIEPVGTPHGSPPMLLTSSMVLQGALVGSTDHKMVVHKVSDASRKS